MKMSDKGVLELAESEGIVPAPYLDSKGIWTWGVGHTLGAGQPNPANMPRGMPANIDGAIAEVLEQFQKDLVIYEQRVNAAVKVPLEQHEFDALVHFDFNTGGIHRAKLTKALNAGDREGAAKGFMGWLKPPEIKTRRKHEQQLFRTGNYDANGDEITVWKVDENGRLRGVHSVISGDELLARMKRNPPAEGRSKDGFFSGILSAICAFIKKG